MLDVQTNHVDVFEVSPRDKGSLKADIKVSSLDFDWGLVHNFSSVTMVDRENAILIGGCK
jgi:hypothetical protein